MEGMGWMQPQIEDGIHSVCVLCQSVGIHSTCTLETEPSEWNSAAAGIIHTCTFHRETSSGEEKGSL